MAHEFDGAKYEKASIHQHDWGTRLIGELSLRGDERVLDLGCGNGTVTSELAALVPRGEVIGIDASQGMIDAARPKEQDNLSFRRMDIDDLNFVEEFDLVFSNAALHWIKDHRRLLGNVHRALRAGGHLRFNFAGDGNCSNFFCVVRELMAQSEFEPFFSAFAWPWHMPRLDEYQTVVESIGFREIRVWKENADRFFPSEEAMIAWIDQPSLVPFLAHVPAEAGATFRDLVIRRMLERTRTPDGQCFETFRRINVSAVK